MQGSLRSTAVYILTAISVFATACGGGGGTNGGGTQTPVTPTVAVSPAASSITTAQSLTVTVTVTGSSGTPTGTVVLSGSTYTSSATALSGGRASITIPANTFATGNVTLKASYTPDSASTSLYNASTGQSSAITVSSAPVITVTVDQSGTSTPVTDQLLGMNLAAWYDVAANATGVNSAFSQAGIKAIRWPGGSWSDMYHWGKGGVTPFIVYRHRQRHRLGRKRYLLAICIFDRAGWQLRPSAHRQLRQQCRLHRRRRSDRSSRVGY